MSVRVNNPEADQFYIVIENTKDAELYREKFINKTFEINYRLPRPENDNQYSLMVSSKNKALSQKFAIKVISRYVEDVSVTKLQ